jgi:3-oxoacyl-[acyl-carrier protein] reductase
MDLGLEGRVYIVTGASRGLGRATAEVLVAEGARVVLNARDEDRLNAASAQLGGADVALPIAGDLAEEDLASRLIASAHARFGRLDGAVVSVGGPPPGSALDVTGSTWREAFDTVFVGPVQLMTAVARSSGFEGTAIVVILSSSVRQPLHGLDVSNGLRPGLAMVAKSLADELGPAGVRINTLLPGRIDTDRVRELDARSADPTQARRSQESLIPLGRYGQPEEFGRAAAFLLSPAASYISGVALPVDGGFSRVL